MRPKSRGTLCSMKFVAHTLLHSWIVFSASLAIGDENPFGDLDPFGGESGLQPAGIKDFKVSKTGRNKDLLLRIFDTKSDLEFLITLFPNTVLPY